MDIPAPFDNLRYAQSTKGTHSYGAWWPHCWPTRKNSSWTLDPRPSARTYSGKAVLPHGCQKAGKCSVVIEYSCMKRANTRGKTTDPSPFRLLYTHHTSERYTTKSSYSLSKRYQTPLSFSECKLLPIAHRIRTA